MNPNWHFATKAVHAGERRKAEFVPVATPVQNSVCYLYDIETMDAIFAGTQEGYVYSRYANPTVDALEEAVASLEGGEAAVAYSTGMAAVHAALLGAGIEAGKRVVASQDCYGATYTLLTEFLPKLGIEVTFVDATNIEEVRLALRGGGIGELAEHAAVLFVETMSNPLLKLADITTLAEICRRYGTTLIVDNTFATPCLCQPLKLGADFVVHSATKFLNGHADAMGGLVITSKKKAETLRLQRRTLGTNLGPNEAYLVLRGLKTLPLRMQKQCDNAAAIARFLSEHPKIERVIYPGLPNHPQHVLAKQLFGQGQRPAPTGGALVTFELSLPSEIRNPKSEIREAIFRFLRSLKLCLPATSLGDIYTLVLYPPMSSHRMLPQEERQRLGISDDLLRLSAGIEDVDDLIADLEQALEQL